MFQILPSPLKHETPKTLEKLLKLLRKWPSFIVSKSFKNITIVYILYTEQNSFWFYLENENISDKVEN